MKWLLAPSQRRLLARFARSRLLVAFDYDGTLAPILRNPDDVRLPRRTRGLLTRVAERYPCAVISGRSRRDVAARLEGIPLVAVIGNHGMEPYRTLRGHGGRVRGWSRTLQKHLDDCPGVRIENKGPSLTVHYRAAAIPRDAREAINRAIASLRASVRVIPGKRVVNVVPAGAEDKGTALVRLRASLRADAALFVGDDATDEDIFAIDDPARLLSVRIGHRSDSAAPYFLKSRREIDDLLACLLQLRPASSGVPAPASA